MSTRREVMRAGLGLMLAAPLGACGFQPVYMPTASGRPGPAARELAAIHVNLIPERSGQLLRQALQQRLYGSDESVTPKYDLSVIYWISGEGIGILPNTTVTRIRLIGHANWSLLARDAAKTKIAIGTSSAFDGVNVLDNQYFGGDLQSEEANARLADALADQITLRLASIFRKQAD